LEIKVLVLARDNLKLLLDLREMIFEPVMVGTITPSTPNGMNITEISKLQSQEK
jgi:hypothetical protein